jgi:hypothetical protein
MLSMVWQNAKHKNTIKTIQPSSSARRSSNPFKFAEIQV